MKKRKCIMKNMETGAEDKNQQTAIYVMTHKAFTPPPDPLYIPLHVGRAAASSYSRDEKSSPLSFCVGDNTGDHISEKNCYYSELTGMYWVWKNSHAKVVGTCHYRRYLLNEQGKLFTEAQILSLLQQYDVITTKELQLNFSYYEGFASHHKILYLDETARVIQEIYPDYAADFQQLVQQKHTYFGNMLIAKKEVYDAYMEWLFSILFEVERRVKVEEEDSYHRRIFGFISEFLQYVWIRHNRLRVYAQFKDTTSLTDSTAVAAAVNKILKRQAYEKYVSDHKKPWNQHAGKPMAKGEFSQWTDISTPRWGTLVENWFGESVQLHQDHLLEDTLRSRPVVVAYRSAVNYVVEALLVVLFAAGVWAGRRNRFLWLVMSFFAFDVFIHIVLGFGINEVYIMGAHWLFVMPLAIGFLMKRMGGMARLGLRVVMAAVALWLLAYNGCLFAEYLLGA